MHDLQLNFTVNSPEERVLNLSVHYHSLKHWTFTNHKLYHTMNGVQQRPDNTQTMV